MLGLGPQNNDIAPHSCLPGVLIPKMFLGPKQIGVLYNFEFNNVMGPDLRQPSDTFQTPSKHLPDNLQTPSRHLPDTLQTYFRHLPAFI